MKYLKEIGINIQNEKLLNTAFTHTSYSHEHFNQDNYERLEFLGDAVLELIISEYYYSKTKLNEGDMSRKRASYVCEQALAFYAKKIGLNNYIKVGNGQLKLDNDVIIADVFEAVLGVIYLDQGLDSAKLFINKTVIPYIEKDYHFFADYKTALQELIQTGNEVIEYVLIKETGKPNDKTFEVAVKINNIIYGKGCGKNKKEAEQKAAYNAYKKCAK